MEAANKQSHLTFGDRQIIQKGIENGSSKKTMSDLLGKDKSTIGKEIKLHRELTYKCRFPLECASYAHCRFSRVCTIQCQGFVQFTCTRRDRSPGPATGARSTAAADLISSDIMPIMRTLLTVIPSWNRELVLTPR